MADAATKEARAELESLQERLESAAPPLQARNINVDAHQGHMPQRPYARLEDEMARLVSGYHSFDQLLSVLPRDEKQKLVKGSDGALYRLVTEGTGVQVVKDGTVYDQVRKVRRAIALQQKIARGQTAAGIPTDYWNGFTWLRGGFKPEKDFTDILQARAGDAEEFELVEASAHDQMLHAARETRVAAVAPIAAPARSASEKKE